MKLTNVLESRARLGEGPLWNDENQCLYWVDIYNHRVHQFDTNMGETHCFNVGEIVGSIALAPDDRLIMALQHQLAFLDLKTGAISPITTIEADQPHNRCNDGKCDAKGRFWFGTMCTVGQQGALYRYDSDGALHVMETGLTVSNGLGWSPDNQTFYLADSPLQRIFAYDYDVETGSIENRRVFVDLTYQTAYPDGLTVDQEGCIWSAMWDGWCVIRFDPNGQEMVRVPMPVQRPTCCTFGGPELKHLYITTASVGLSEAEIQESFFSGDLFCLETDVSGMPTYRYGN